ncbi:hypothetical protein ENSA5_35280 [Enhygromyxa salina]|uniref:Gamma-glutamylcyclotransferase AIG2-like domain-containing protein n=1 Tax=Enhygromyxa salina TaxID=215803 RepID=A0A2S9XV95_9BACT|nr:gamma-glutamylcyclotransferase family protein [Enhygromyxa salina]PRP96754.1 hypothetical protein ENSA5_35280 [Enhygromyxa salina]
MRYFAYGSNMSRARLEQRVGPTLVLGPARLEGYRHRFSKLGTDGSGKGNIELHLGESVWGVVYELDDRQLARLVDFELGYRQTSLPVPLVGATATRVTSFEAHTIVPGLAPTSAYVEHYVIGMREHGIPDDYRMRILRGITSESS